MSKHCQRVFDHVFTDWDSGKSGRVLLQYGVMLVLRVCQSLAEQNSIDNKLDVDLVTACKNYFERVAPGRFRWQNRAVK